VTSYSGEAECNANCPEPCVSFPQGVQPDIACPPSTTTTTTTVEPCPCEPVVTSGFTNVYNGDYFLYEPLGGKPHYQDGYTNPTHILWSINNSRWEIWFGCKGEYTGGNPPNYGCNNPALAWSTNFNTSCPYSATWEESNGNNLGITEGGGECTSTTSAPTTTTETPDPCCASGTLMKAKLCVQGGGDNEFYGGFVYVCDINNQSPANGDFVVATKCSDASFVCLQIEDNTNQAGQTGEFEMQSACQNALCDCNHCT
tara:strand:- start:1062 stop:1832 length:771 start_codon:yes stop_codon:yes gene_type:complete